MELDCILQGYGFWERYVVQSIQLHIDCKIQIGLVYLLLHFLCIINMELAIESSRQRIKYKFEISGLSHPGHNISFDIST